MELINSGMRKGIKGMCVVAQTAQFIALMPKPQDFVIRVIGDVVYLSAQVKKLSDEMNKMLDAYADIPVNYLMTQMNSITGSLSNVTHKLADFSSGMVDQTLGLAEGMTSTITEITGSAIDIAGATTDAVVGLGSALVETPANITGQTEFASDVHDGTEVIMEWTENGFNNISDKSIGALNKATDAIVDANQTAQNAIGDAADFVDDKLAYAYKWVEDLIKQLRDAVKNLEDTIDGGFKDVTGLSSVSSGADKATQALSQMENNPLAQGASAITSTMSEVINNFSIGKVVGAFTGILTQSLIVEIGLDNLPPIDFEAMLCQIRDDLEMTTKDLYEEYKAMNDDIDKSYDDFIKFGDESANIPSEERDYSSENYQKFIKEYGEDLKNQRDRIRTLMKYYDGVRVVTKVDESGNETKHFVDKDGNPLINENGDEIDFDFKKFDTLTRRELKSAIKEARKYRKKVKRAKQTVKFKDIITNELKNLKQEAKYRCNSIKSDWLSMMDQYKNAIKEIKEFFTTGGSCDMFIDDCCNAINKDCDDIKELCKSIATQLIGCSLKTAMPADIGPLFPNPAYKIADFWMDIKTIFKFLKDLLTLIMDIMNNINKLARIMLNGLNSLTEIIKQLMELIGLKWLMDLIQGIIDGFAENITNAKELLENSLSPVYFSDTQEYENCMEALETLTSEDGGLNKEKLGYLEDMQNYGGSIFGTDFDISTLGSIIVTGMSTEQNTSTKQAEKIDKIIENLEEKADEIVAYKSPIIKESGEPKTVSDLMNGGQMNQDIKFVGWHFFHPNLNHVSGVYYTGWFRGLIEKIKSKIMKKAAKTGNKKNGGVYKLKNKNIGGSKLAGFRTGKVDTAYKAFYWYTYYTEDLEQDCFDRTAVQGSTKISSVVQTENGSIVELDDGRKVFVANNNVRSGDYVVVEGVRYRVK